MICAAHQIYNVPGYFTCATGVFIHEAGIMVIGAESPGRNSPLLDLRDGLLIGVDDYNGTVIDIVAWWGGNSKVSVHPILASFGIYYFEDDVIRRDRYRCIHHISSVTAEHWRGRRTGGGTYTADRGVRIVTSQIVQPNMMNIGSLVMVYETVLIRAESPECPTANVMGEVLIEYLGVIGQANGESYRVCSLANVATLAGFHLVVTFC